MFGAVRIQIMENSHKARTYYTQRITTRKLIIREFITTTYSCQNITCQTSRANVTLY